jgi:hypothetical protein
VSSGDAGLGAAELAGTAGADRLCGRAASLRATFGKLSNDEVGCGDGSVRRTCVAASAETVASAAFVASAFAAAAVGSAGVAAAVRDVSSVRAAIGSEVEGGARAAASSAGRSTGGPDLVRTCAV